MLVSVLESLLKATLSLSLACLHPLLSLYPFVFKANLELNAIQADLKLLRPVNLNEVNPSTPRHKCRGLLRVDPERRFLSPPSDAGVSAVERVKDL